MVNLTSDSLPRVQVQELTVQGPLRECFNPALRKKRQVQL